MALVAPTNRNPIDTFTVEDQIHLRGLINTTTDFLHLEMCKFYTR